MKYLLTMQFDRGLDFGTHVSSEEGVPLCRNGLRRACPDVDHRRPFEVRLQKAKPSGDKFIRLYRADSAMRSHPAFRRLRWYYDWGHKPWQFVLEVTADTVLNRIADSEYVDELYATFWQEDAD